MSDPEDRVAQEARTADGMTLVELSREIPGGTTHVEGDGNVRCFGVHHDSRRVMPGDLFAVRRGALHDGSAFVRDAAARGAVALLAERGVSLDTSLPVLRVEDVHQGLAHAAAAVYGHPAFALDVIGITGTNGKTTTSHLVRAAVDGALSETRCGVIGTTGHSYAGHTFAASHTTPEADELARVLAVMRKRGAKYIAMEVSSIALMLQRVAAVRFRVAAFTNLTQDHLDFHGSMAAYADAKKKLFTTLDPGLAVVHVDDPFGDELAKVATCRVVRVRTKVGVAEGDVVPRSVTASAHGMDIVARVLGETIRIRSRLIGMHNLENLLVAIGIAGSLELDVQRAADALESEIGAPGRLERCDGPVDDILVLVDYAHTPDALARVLGAVKGVSDPVKSRVICVFGCGGDRDPTKRGPMGRAAASHADVLVVTNDNPRTEAPEAIVEPIEQAIRDAGITSVTAPEIAAGARGYLVELDRHEAILLAIRSAKPSDIVLIAGKGHEDYQIVGTEKRPFDDRAEARGALHVRRMEKSRQ